jgi:hypothetical protein
MLGEKLLLRLEERLRRRPRIGFSPGFYARFGLKDPWMMDSFGGDPLQQEEAFTHLSGASFYAHLAKLGRRRWWRDRRELGRQENLAGLKTARRVRYPGENSGLSFHGLMPPNALSRLALAMHLPTPMGLESEDPLEADEDVGPTWYRGRGFVPSAPSQRPWNSVDHASARVIRGVDVGQQGGRTDERPMSRVGSRLLQAQGSRDPLLRDLEAVSGLLSTKKRRRVTRVLSQTEHLPREERIVLLRKILGGGASARIIRFQVERDLEGAKTAHLDRALGRRLPHSKGLRPVLRNSPSVEWSLPQPLGAETLVPLDSDLESRPLFRRAGSRFERQTLSASPVQSATDSRRPMERRRQSQTILARLDAANRSESLPTVVAPSIVQKTPGRFEPISPVRDATYIAPLGREETDLGADSEQAFLETPVRRAERGVEVHQPEMEPLDPSVLHKTPKAPKATPTRWAAARLDSPSVSADFASSAPLLSTLPLRIERAAEDHGRFLKVDVTGEEAGRLGVRPMVSAIPNMSLLEESESPVGVDDESGSVWHRTPKSQVEAKVKRPQWDRSELIASSEDGAEAQEDTRAWPRSAPKREGWQAAPNDSFAATSDHGWFRTPDGVLLRSKGFKTPSGKWVSSPNYRTPGGALEPSKGFKTPSGEWVSSPSHLTPQGQRGFPGLRFEPVFPEFFGEEDVRETEVEAKRPGVRLFSRAGLAPVARSAPSKAHKMPSADLGDSLRLLSQGKSDIASPSWSDRAVGGTKIRASSELIRHLAQARDPEEIIRLIVDKGQDLTRESTLAAPVVEVIQQMKSEAAKMEARSSETTPRRGARSFSGNRGPSRAARRVRGFQTLRGPGATSASGMGEDRVMKLAGKLRSLIHLAEVENRQGEARSQARLSADEAPSVQTAAPVDAVESASDGDVEALIQEIVSAVNREMNLRRERRQEDSHEPWW